MKSMIVSAAILGLTASASFAGELAAPNAVPLDEPMQLTDVQMDGVKAGALIRVDVQNVLNRNEVDVDVPVTVRDINANVAAAVAVLGTAGAVGGIAD